jgi:hypothetical protein
MSKRKTCDMTMPMLTPEVERNSFKISKTKEDHTIGICDQCEKRKPVRPDKDFPAFNFCIDCEIEDLIFWFQFSELSSDIP